MGFKRKEMKRKTNIKIKETTFVLLLLKRGPSEFALNLYAEKNQVCLFLVIFRHIRQKLEFKNQTIAPIPRRLRQF